MLTFDFVVPDPFSEPDTMTRAVAITDRMKYGVKPSAVRSENYLHNIKASNGPQFEV